jgi:hypothetical protein
VKSTRLRTIALAALVLFVAPMPALAQSCALCYTQAASAGARMIQALQSGILVLIAPPTLASIGMIFILYRKRSQIRKAADVAEPDAIWESTDLSSSTTSPWLPPAQ